MAQILDGGASAVTLSRWADLGGQRGQTFGLELQSAGRVGVVVPVGRLTPAWERHRASLQMARGA